MFDKKILHFVTCNSFCLAQFPRLMCALFGITRRKMTTPDQDGLRTASTPAMKRKRLNIPSPDAEY